MMKLTPSMLRMLVCSLMGLFLISNGISAMQTTNVAEMTFAPFSVAMGMFMLMFAFVPSLGKSIIKSITSILRHR